MHLRQKLLFTAISAAILVAAISALITQSQTVSTRHFGLVTLTGDNALWLGRTGLLLAVLPLVVWLPARLVGTSIVVWWVALMSWLLGPLLLR